MRDLDQLLLAEIEELLPEHLFDDHVHGWQRGLLRLSAAGLEAIRYGNAERLVQRTAAGGTGAAAAIR